jgi:hypothetical protein
MYKATVCAIVLDYFGAEQTKQCLTSLIRQGLTTVYVLDNSADAVATMRLREMIEALTRIGLDYKTQILSAGRNLGFGKGINFVIAHDKSSTSPHDFYMLLNNDAVAGTGLVSGLLEALENDPQAALVAPRVVSSNPGREYGIWYQRFLGLLLSEPGRFRFLYFTGCCLLLPRNLVDKTALFDEAFFMYGEDAELGWRLTRQKKKMICAADVFVEHEYGPSVDRSSFFYEYHIVRGHLLLSWRIWSHPVEIPIFLITKAISLTFRAVLRCCRYRTLVPLGALFVAWLPLRIHKT